MLVGVFRGIAVASVPAQLQPFYIATEIEADPQEAGEHRFDIQMIDEDGVVLYTNQIEAEFRQRPDYLPNYMYFCGQVFVQRTIERAGIYRFDLRWRDETLAEARLEIELAAQA